MTTKSPALDMMRLGLASWETIWHRLALMASGTCSAAEYHSMVCEKMAASHASMMALMMGGNGTAIMAPYLKAATANAKRLRG